MKETTFEEQSSLKIYSLGIVVKSEDPKTKEIQVSPIESMNVQQPGIISQNKIEFRGSHPDDKGVSTSGNVKAENYVKAKWICIGSSNRVTAPNVYPNETVLLFRYSNNDVYYWTSIFHEPELRKKEAATFAFSNLSVAKGWTGNTPIAYTKDTSYWLEVDAIKKLVSLSTPDNDGEAAKYTFEIDVTKSVLTIKDNKTNVVKIDSKKGIEVTTDLKTVVKGKAGVDVEADSVINLKAPNVIASGNLIVKGKLTANGLAITGGANISGDINCGKIFCSSIVQSGSSKKVETIEVSTEASPAKVSATPTGGASAGTSAVAPGAGINVVATDPVTSAPPSVTVGGTSSVAPSPAVRPAPTAADIFYSDERVRQYAEARVRRDAAYVIFLSQKQARILANPDSQEAKDYISKPPSPFSIFNDEFIKGYKDTGVFVPRTYLEGSSSGTGLADALKNLKT